MKSAGFTLMELMVAIAIISILATMAMPSYQTYIARSQVAESLGLVGELKATVAGYYKHSGQFPVDNAAAGIPGPQYLIGNYVTGIELSGGAFNIHMGNKANGLLTGKILTVRPIVVTGSPASPLSWICGNSSIPQGMEAVGSNQTNIDAAALPVSCRI